MDNKNNETKLIIFDYDGVLIDSFPMACEIYNDFFEKFGILNKFNNGNKFDDHYFRNFFDVNWKLPLNNMGFTDDMLNECAKSYFSRFNSDSSKMLFDGIEDVLKILKNQGYKIAIASNNKEDAIKLRLTKEGIIDCFDLIIDDSFGMKPDPAGVIAALDKLSISPENAVLIGDMDGDIEAAQNANLKKAIAVTWGYHLKKKLLNADVIIDSPEQLLEAIK